MATGRCARRKHGRGTHIRRLRRQVAQARKRAIVPAVDLKRQRDVPLDVPEPALKLSKLSTPPEPRAWGEPSREEAGLQLIGDLAPKGTAWTYPLIDEEWRCFAGYLPRAIQPSQSADFYDKVNKGTKWLQPSGRWGPLPLKTAWMTASPCSCKYRYGGAEVLPEPYPDWMREILGVLMPLCGLHLPESWPNSCNLNLYKDGQHSVGWHADNESLFQGKVQDIRIISLSLGQTRKFEVQCKGSPTTRLELADGDLCTMEGLFQKHYQHRVGKDSGKNIGPRINITWRWVVDHTVDCRASTTACAATAIGTTVAKAFVTARR